MSNRGGEFHHASDNDSDGSDHFIPAKTKQRNPFSSSFHSSSSSSSLLDASGSEREGDEFLDDVSEDSNNAAFSDDDDYDVNRNVPSRNKTQSSQKRSVNIASLPPDQRKATAKTREEDGRVLKKNKKPLPSSYHFTNDQMVARDDADGDFDDEDYFTANPPPMPFLSSSGGALDAAEEMDRLRSIVARQQQEQARHGLFGFDSPSSPSQPHLSSSSSSNITGRSSSSSSSKRIDGKKKRSSLSSDSSSSSVVSSSSSSMETLLPTHNSTATRKRREGKRDEKTTRRNAHDGSTENVGAKKETKELQNASGMLKAKKHNQQAASPSS